jgi:hypothetical protein
MCLVFVYELDNTIKCHLLGITSDKTWLDVLLLINKLRFFNFNLLIERIFILVKSVEFLKKISYHNIKNYMPNFQ